MAKITTPDSLYGNSRDILREAERENEILADIAGEEYESPGDIPKGKYVIEKRLLDAAQKKNELLESIAEGSGTISGANKLAIDYGTDVLSLKKGDEPIANSGVTLPAYGLSYDSSTGGLTLTKNGTAISGQTVSIPDYGSPLTASSAAGMTDTDKVYVYTGETSASLTNGHWYYYDGDSWEDGGTYNSQGIDTDTTLLVSGAPADAKATGDAVGELKTQIDKAVDNEETWTNISLTVQTDGRYDTSGVFHSDTGRRYAIVSPVVPGEHYRLSTIISSTLIPAILYFNGDSFLSYEKTGNGTQETVTNYEFTIPATCNKLIVQNTTSATGEFKLEKLSESEYVFKAYTKAESDARFAQKSDVYTKTEADDAFYSAASGEEVENAIEGIQDDIYEGTQSWNNVTLTVETTGSYRTDGSFVSTDTGRRHATVTPVTPGDSYRLSTVVSSTLIPAILFFNGDTFLSYLKTGSGTQETVTNYEFTIPQNANKLIVQNSTTATGEFKLEKYATVHELNVYTKSEVDSLVENSGDKRYGIKWEIANVDDEGQRCFDAIGLSANIGVGTTAGSSDFDTIYPWSGMKRCNIKQNANGASIVTFEGETGFATDGTNGDVFVYVPRFNYERYTSGGYEYHVISGPGSDAPVHEAFIDGDKILDGIYLGAYEASISGSKLHSVSGVIPGNNIVPADFLTYAQANGDNYSLYGIKEVSAVWVLMAVEFGKRNSNRIFGYGASDFEQPATYLTRDIITTAATNTNTVRTAKWSTEHKGYMPIGSNITVCDADQRNILTQAKITNCVDGTDYTDWTFDGNPIDVDTDCFVGSAPLNTGFVEDAPSGALSWHTGRANWISGSTVRNPMRYRWIENIFGNVWHFLPDVTFDDCQMYVCGTISKYGFGKTNDGYTPRGMVYTEQTSNGSKADSTGVNYWVESLNYDPLNKDVIMGRTYDTSLTSAKAFGAYYYMQAGIKIVCNGGGFDHLYRSNILTNRVWDGVNIKWYLYGARMIFKNVH